MISRKSFLVSLSLIIIWSLSVQLNAELSVWGQLASRETGKPIAYANIILENGGGTFSDEEGKFVLDVNRLPVILTISHIAFRDTMIEANNRDIGILYLSANVLYGKDIFVTATRAVEGITPVAFSNVTAAEIKTRYTVEDVPMILAMEPGVYSYSESGNGTGYSYVQIRGFDQSRIAVMLNNVPLNDNESYQVYWVDHGNILDDAANVQIQRGIGNSLYGSSAFGGSINVQTVVGSEKPGAELEIGGGSYNTSKLNLKVSSGKFWNNRLNTSVRLSQIGSDGYRDYHNSFQQAASVGLDYYGQKVTHEFRALIGYERTHLDWWGVPVEDINDRQLRKAGYKSYIDDFKQQVYSINSQWNINNNLHLSNVGYFVKGEGYYETEKSSAYDPAVGDISACDEFNAFLQSYNLDGYYPGYPWDGKAAMELGFTRRKWIVNDYFGVIPTLTYLKDKFRIDLGGELRFYRGDHFGEISNFSDEELSQMITGDWYRYYRYIGDKRIGTAFIHTTVNPLRNLRIVGDLQYQTINWQLDQKKIGYAPGYQLNADWQFLNPRFGMIYSIGKDWSLFANYGKAQREPADNRIIEADNIWGKPVKAAAEAIHDLELGTSINKSIWNASINLYRIRYFNEQLKNIDIEQEGEYDYYQAGKTLHRGIEVEFGFRQSKYWSLNLNGSFSEHVFSDGGLKGNRLPNVPGILVNGSLAVNPVSHVSLLLTSRYVGKQYIDDENIGVNPEFWLFDGGIRLSFKHIELNAKVKNIFDVLYSTSGYGYEWDGYWAYLWPGATRNAFVSLAVKL